MGGYAEAEDKNEVSTTNGEVVYFRFVILM